MAPPPALERPRTPAPPASSGGRARAGRAGTSLVTRLAVTITALVGAAVAIPATLALVSRSGELYSRVVDNAIGRGQVATIAAADAISDSDSGELSRLAASLVSEQNRVSAAVIVDAGGNPLARYSLETVTTPGEHIPVPSTVIVEHDLRAGRNCVLVTAPIVLEGMPWGALRQVIDLSTLEAAEHQLLLQLIGVGLGLLVVSIGFAVLIARSVARPLRRLVAAAGEVARGNLDFRADVRGGDEVGALADAFTHMTTQLRASNQQLRQQSAALEQQVVERTAELEMARDAALGAARAKSEFLANMSHEIRTPLNGLLGFLTLLSETGLDVRQQEYLNVARGSGEALLALLNDILDLSKIEAGKLSLENIEFDRDDLLETVACLFAPIAQAKGVEFLLNVAPECPVRLRSDPTRLRQVLSNLLGNAVKFTAQGEVELRVWAGPPHGSRCLVHFEVRDTGEGIPRDRLKFLFNAFQQADGSTSRKHGGTGLGLAIVKRIVTQMGGKTRVETEVGRGSRFFVSVPVEIVVSPTRDRRVGDALGMPSMIVDGHRVRAELLQRQLHGLGADVHVASDIAAAAPQLRAWGAAGATSIVFVDDSLGVALAEALPDLAPCVRRYVLRPANTANDPVPAGFSAALVKPLRRAVLVRTMTLTPAAALPTPEAKSAPHAGLDDAASPHLGAAGDGAAEAMQTPAFDGSNCQLLVVEDNVVNQRLMAAILQKLGIKPTIVGDGKQAVEAWGRARFDAILMDMQMPVMDGLQASAEIRRLEAGGAHVPIIALTANALAGDRERCLAAGMDDYLTKPVRTPQLRDTLARWCPAAVAGATHKDAAPAT